MKKETLMVALVAIGLLMVAAGIVIPFFKGAEFEPARWIYTFGAAILLIGRVLSLYNGDNLRQKRLCRMELISALLFFVAGLYWLGVIPEIAGSTVMRDVLAFTMAGGIMQIYTSVMIPRVAAKDAER